MKETRPSFRMRACRLAASLALLVAPGLDAQIDDCMISPQIRCLRNHGDICAYELSLELDNPTQATGQLQIEISPGHVNPSEHNVDPGPNTVFSEMNVECGMTIELEVVVLFADGSACKSAETLALPQCVCGLKLHDANCDGVADREDPALSDWTIYLDRNNDGELSEPPDTSVKTDELGRWCLGYPAPPHGFPGSVREVLQPGWFLKSPASGQFDPPFTGEQLDFLNCKDCGAEIEPEKPNLCAGESTTVSLAPGTSGSATWYFTPGPDCPAVDAPDSPWQALGGGTSWNTLVLNQTTCYQALVSGLPDCPDTVASNVVEIKVSPTSDVGAITCSLIGGGSCPAELCSPAAVQLSAESANCPLQWQANVGGQWQDIDGATSSELGPLSLISSTCPSTSYPYRVESTCDPCPPDDATTGLTVFRPSGGGVLTAAKNPICAGDDNVLRLGSFCGDEVEWQISNDCDAWHGIDGAAGATTWFTNKLFEDTCYRVRVTNGPCPAADSNPVLVDVIPEPKVTVSISGDTTFCAPGSVTLTAIGTPAGPQPVSYQWFHDGLPVAGGATLEASVSGNYQVVYSTGCGSVKSELIKVRAIDVLADIAGPCGVCPPDCITLQALATGGDAPYLFGWFPLGVISPTLNACPTEPTTYQLLVFDANGCFAAAAHRVEICEKFEVDAGADRTICRYTTTTLGGTPTLIGGGMAPYTYDWSPAAGLSSSTVANPAAIGIGPTTYTLTVTDAQGCQATDTVEVDVELCNPWSLLIESGLLRGEDDPVNRALERARLALVGSDLQPAIEEWYARLNERDWVTPILQDPASRLQAELLLNVGRGLIEQGQQLRPLHLPLIREALRALERQGAPAPEGLIAEAMERLGGAVGRPWLEVVEALVGEGPTHQGTWTPWLNRDAPGGVGDFETLRDFVDAGQACPAPRAIECQTRDRISWEEAGQVYSCTVGRGGVCRNDDQPDSTCLDYQVRFLCPSASDP